MNTEDKAFYLQLLHTRFDTWELRYSSEGKRFCRLFQISREQASEMACDGWKVTEEKVS